MSHPFTFRPGTHDEAMFRHLTSHNEYQLPNVIGPEETIVDVGVHIGSFCYSALTRGACRVFGFEAEPSNYECASRNLAPFGDRVTLANRAVWRSDRRAGRLNFGYSTDRGNTGGGGVVFGVADGPGIDTVPFDDIVDEISEHGRRRINLLKIDCEGSEFPILLTSRRLHLIDRIAGEYHEIGCATNPQAIPEGVRVPGVEEFTIQALATYLESQGFEVRSERVPGTSLGLFFAVNRGRPGAVGRARRMWHQLSRHTPMGLLRGARRIAAGSTQ